MAIEIYANLDQLSAAGADLFVRTANHAIAQNGRFSVALAGGSTPERMYHLLATEKYCTAVDWNSVHVFWGDERCVPADDPRSNAGMARLAWLDHVPIPKSQIHPMSGAAKPEAAAAAYEAALRSYFAGGPPAFDLILLGMGENGHTASLFPHTTSLNETSRWVAEVYVEEVSMWRITLTAPAINQAKLIAFLVAGAPKAGVLREVLEGPAEPQRLPSQLIKPQQGSLVWLTDAAAAAELTR